MKLLKNIKEKKDTEFITKTKFKRFKFNDYVKNEKISLAQQFNQSRWLLEIPFEDGITEYSVECFNISNVRLDGSYCDLQIKGQDQQMLIKWFQQSMNMTYINQKKNLNIVSIDKTGLVVNRLELYGCIPTEINYQQNYDNHYDDMNPSIMDIGLSIDKIDVTKRAI